MINTASHNYYLLDGFGFQFFEDFAIDAQGRIVLASNPGLIALNSDGNLDLTFDDNGFQDIPFNFFTEVDFDDSGRLVLNGQSPMFLVLISQQRLLQGLNWDSRPAGLGAWNRKASPKQRRRQMLSQVRRPQSRYNSVLANNLGFFCSP